MRIDTHMHLFPTAREGREVLADFPIVEYGEWQGVRFSDRAGAVRDGIDALREAGASYGCVLGSFELAGLPPPPCSARWWPAQPPHAAERDALLAYNGWLCELAAAHAELLAFVTVHPGVLGPREAAMHVAELADRRAARGLKLHPIALRTHVDDPALTPTFEVCSDRSMPVVVHCGPDRRGAGWCRPAAFAPVAERHPRLPLVLAHLGGAAWRELAAVADAFPALRFDLAEIIEWVGAPHAPSARELVELIRAVGSERVLLGSDFPWYDPASTISAVLELPGLADEERAGILGLNAARMLDLAV